MPQPPAARMSPQEIEVVSGGMRLRETGLFLDARQPTDLAFISHAHGDHAARHRRVVGTSATLKLLARRIGRLPAALPAPFRQPFTLDGIELELYPAGHVLGSAQLKMTYRDRCVVYTGDLNTIPSLLAEPAQIPRCDVLVIESTFGHPRYRFPPREQIHGAIRDFVRAALAERATPVLFAYTLGKSQEAMRLLADSGVPVAVHACIADIATVYAELGHVLPHRRFDGEMQLGEALILPPHLIRARSLEKLGPVRTAILTGWALDPGAPSRFGVDAAFPLSDHADFEGLLDYVEKSGARKILTVHGLAKELAACLRDRGFEARPLEEPPQLELPL